MNDANSNSYQYALQRVLGGNTNAFEILDTHYTSAISHLKATSLEILTKLKTKISENKKEMKKMEKTDPEGARAL